ncbi:MAG: FAD-binding oxidoreductase, partial [Candidatus Methylomirabilis sp.]|nr:FAD-binding oxidoreductase [Deltaproteobacteria bacterium]
MSAERAETVIIGGGVAGASLAWRLAERGARDVVLIEREETHDYHATGRSAATFHVLIPEPATLLLSHASAPFFSHPPPGFSEAPLIRRVGTLLVGRGAPLVRQR